MKRMRFFSLGGVAIALLWTANPLCYSADTEHADIKAEITKRHDEAVKRLQDWIAQVSIAAENRGYPEGAEYMAKLARDAGFQHATVINTDGKPGVFATLDAGAPKTVGLYFMYDVKQFDPAEWSSPPTEARIVDKPPLGKVMIGRGAVNQKGPEAAFLAALHAIRGAGKKMPVNLVMVAEGEEEIGSPHIPQLVRRPEVLRRAEEVRRRVHAVCGTGPRRDRHGEPRIEGRYRARACLERRKVGTRSGKGHSLFAQGDGGQPGVASGQSAQHARVRRR